MLCKESKQGEKGLLEGMFVFSLKLVQGFSNQGLDPVEP